MAQQIEIDIGHENHLRVWRCLGPSTIGRESEVARRKHARLSILDIHIVHTWQIADAAGDDDEAFILYGTRMSAYAHARVGILRVGQERDKQNLHSLVGHQARQLRKFHIVATCCLHTIPSSLSRRA